MIQIVLHRNLSLVVACSDGLQWVWEETSHGWQGKSADLRRAHVVGRSGYFGHRGNSTCRLLQHKVQGFQRATRRQPLPCGHPAS
jgi:hypothetical protein